MKKIIKRILYNTQTAKKLGEHSHGYVGDLDYYCEELYQKKSGEYFLYGVGGPMSAYCVQTATNEWSGSEEITPMTVKEARRWAEDNLDADDYIAAFGEPGEDDGYQTITVKINTETYNKLERKAKNAGLDISDFVSQLVSETL